MEEGGLIGYIGREATFALIVLPISLFNPVCLFWWMVAHRIVLKLAGRRTGPIFESSDNQSIFWLGCIPMLCVLGVLVHGIVGFFAGWH